jgi:hypothetical protein
MQTIEGKSGIIPLPAGWAMGSSRNDSIPAVGKICPILRPLAFLKPEPRQFEKGIESLQKRRIWRY